MKSARILVIDDEQIICDGCQVVLSDQGHSVDFCINGKAGLELIRKDWFDLLLLDMKLPDIGGMEILRSVRKEMPGIYVIVMTGYPAVEQGL